MEQQIAVTGETEEATIRYRIAYGDLVDDFKKAGPAFEERKQQLIDAAAAMDQFKASEELDKANEQIAQQVIELQAQRIALDEGAAAAFGYQRAARRTGEDARPRDRQPGGIHRRDRSEAPRRRRQRSSCEQADHDDLTGWSRSTKEATQAIIAERDRRGAGRGGGASATASRTAT